MVTDESEKTRQAKRNGKAVLKALPLAEGNFIKLNDIEGKRKEMLKCQPGHWPSRVV
jgi:hypothetical protein